MQKILTTIFFAVLCLTPSILAEIPDPKDANKHDTRAAQAPIDPYVQTANLVISRSVAKQPKKSYLRTLYAYTQDHPIWTKAEGLTPMGRDLLDQIACDVMLDHDTDLYRRYGDIAAEASIPSPSLRTQLKLELKLTQLFWKYAQWKIYGMINWPVFRARLQQIIVTDEIRADWVIYPRYTEETLLGAILESGNMAERFAEIKPAIPRHDDLQKKQYYYQRLHEKGLWPEIREFEKLEPDDEHEIIPSLRKLLYLTEDLAEEDLNLSTRYDATLVEAVKRFQLRHGEEDDGVIGPLTRRHLMRDPEEIAMTIQLNLDRMKIVKFAQKGFQILINIPAFKLYFYRDAEVFQEMKVITGTPRHPTPIFSDEVETVVLNPYWNVPKSIIQKEMIPKLYQDPYAMQKEGIEVRDGWGSNASLVDTAMVDWTQYQYSKHVPFRFAQVPGYGNALGKVKFLFPNQFSVYMHDTPTKHLFARNVRAYSHGCVRLERPVDLLRTFASFNGALEFGRAQQILRGREPAYYDVTHVPVTITYLTTWVDEKGVLQFRNDIYGFDKEQLKYRRRP
jgi:L,D-transpeptidase YcbB